MRRPADRALRGIGRSMHLALPAVVTLGLAFQAGGFFPTAPGIAAVVLTLLLVARITLAERPFAGFGVLLAVSACALAGLAAWTLLSTAWSDSPVRALIEFDRTLLLLLLLVLAGSYAGRPGALAGTLRWTALGMAAISAAGLVTWLLPETFPIDPVTLGERLSFPLTYWNAVGILTAIAVVLATHLTASEVERPLVRVAAAVALPMLAVTLYFTFSRGGIAAGGVGLAVYALLALPRGLPVAALTCLPPVWVAVSAAYGADALADAEVAATAAAAEGREVAVVVLLSMLAAGVLRALGLLADRRLDRIRLAPRVRATVLAGTAAVVLLGAASAAVAVDAPERLAKARDAFVEGESVPVRGDLRARLARPGNNHRLDHWRVAIDMFERDPWRGTGAGTYRLVWERERPEPIRVNDGHSLYLEMAGELGIVGVGLLGIALGTLLLAGLRGLRGGQRHAYAAFTAAGVALLLHASVDWDWEMPALFAWFLGAGGVAAAVPAERARLGSIGRVPRVIAALACLTLAVTPALVAASQEPLDRSVRSFVRGDCATAVDGALDSLERLRARPEPFEILGYCNLRAGAEDLAVGAMQAAQARDPNNFQYAYGLAVAQALAGRDPRANAARAVRLNPFDTPARELNDAVRGTDNRARWQRAAARARVPYE